MSAAGHVELVALRYRVRELETELAIDRRTTELGRGTSTQTDVRGHQSDGRGRTSRRASVRAVGRIGIGLLRLAAAPALGSVDPARVAQRDHRGVSCRLPTDLWREPGSRRAHLGPRHRSVPPDRRDPDETRRAAGRLGAANVPQGPQRGDRNGSRGPRLHTTTTGSAVGHRHHRTPHPRTQGVLRSGAGSPSADESWAGPVDSRPTASLAANALGMAIEGRNPTAGETVTPQRPPHPGRLLGIHPTRDRLRAAGIDGLGRGLLR